MLIRRPSVDRVVGLTEFVNDIVVLATSSYFEEQFLIGDGTQVTFVLSHSFNNLNIDINVYTNNDAKTSVYCEVKRSLSDITLCFNQPPLENSFVCSVCGIRK